MFAIKSCPMWVSVMTASSPLRSKTISCFQLKPPIGLQKSWVSLSFAKSSRPSAVIDTEADDTHVDALDMHGATLAVDAETNRYELSQYAFLADLDADSFVAMIERFAASLVDMRKKIEGAKVLKLFAPRSKR